MCIEIRCEIPWSPSFREITILTAQSEVDDEPVRSGWQPLDRGFNQFVLGPLYENFDGDGVQEGCYGEVLHHARFLSLGNTLLELIIVDLPSLTTAQPYRVELL